MAEEVKIDRRVLLELTNTKHQNILDIGAGDLAVIAAEEFDCNVTSIDVSESLLEQECKRVKRKGLEDKVKLEKADATGLPYYNGEFDTVISYGALHHNLHEKRDSFIEEAFRVAKRKVIIADFKEIHHIHPKDVHPPVDHDWLENKLRQKSKVEKYIGKEKILYVCNLR